MADGTVEIVTKDGKRSGAIPLDQFPGVLKAALQESFEGKRRTRNRRGGPRPPLKSDEGDRRREAHVYEVTADELRQFVEQYEALEKEKADVADRMKEVMAEAKGRGYDTKVLRKVIALRKRDRDDVAEEEAILEMYKTALGM